MKRLFLVMAAALALAACHGRAGKDAPAVPPAVDYAAVEAPAFCADSAYAFVASQVSFGTRVPGQKGWEACAHYLVRQMGRWCDTVVVQEFPTTLWDGAAVRGKNIIASLEPADGSAADKRILLAAHWDSRQWADHDPDEANHRSPLLGANDGASGVGVLMELARVMSVQRPTVGVDFVFFDVEDQGCPEWAETYVDDSWCKGAQYWSRNPHKPFYKAVYGVLLDMVGCEMPRFTKEQVSRQYASGILNKMWTAADALGYGAVFDKRATDPILDDHYYVNTLAGIPMVDIVQNSQSISFFPHWHTLGDDMGHVDARTLGIVGEVILKTVYADYGAK